jgi:pyruvate dehydrogenase E1 component beta subunit
MQHDANEGQWVRVDPGCKLALHPGDSLLALRTAVRQARGGAQVVRSAKKELFMWEALRAAVDEEMERDPTVCIMGARSASN